MQDVILKKCKELNFHILKIWRAQLIFSICRIGARIYVVYVLYVMSNELKTQEAKEFLCGRVVSVSMKSLEHFQIRLQIFKRHFHFR